MSGRYAIYFVPADDSGVARFGNRILGRDALANILSPTGEEHRLQSVLASSVSQYGFHATLKAPFELRFDQSEEALCDGIKRLAGSLSPVSLGGLAVRQMDRHLVLSNVSDSDALRRLAERCVIEIEPFRAPAREADRLTRVRPGMSSRQLQNLEQYGYAHIQEDFRFHMTLGGPIPETLDSSTIDEAGVASYLAWLGTAYNKLVTEPPVLDRLALCFQKDLQSAFVRLDEWVF